LTVVFALVAAAVVILDQITKQILWHHGQNYDFIPGYLHITLVKNAGAAFGLFLGGRAFFIVASVIASIFLVYVAMRLPRSQWQRRVFLGLIFGGAIGNLIDRVMFGEVIDFVRIGIAGHYWPVFNVADMGVSIGAVLLMIALMRADRHDTAPGLEPDPSPDSAPGDNPEPSPDSEPGDNPEPLA
jgi:signal peptidase II